MQTFLLTHIFTVNHPAFKANLVIPKKKLGVLLVFLV